MVFVYQSGTSYSYVPISVIFRSQDVFDPQLASRSGSLARPGFDTLLIAPQGTNFGGVVLIADTVTASAAAVQSARKYQVIEVVTAGIIPTGTHIRAYLRRMS